MKVLTLLFPVDGISSLAVFLSCCSLLLYTVSRATFLTEASALNCWIWDDHWEYNENSILLTCFTDLYTSSNHEIMKSSTSRAYSWSLLPTVCETQNYSCSFPSLQRIQLPNNEQLSCTMSTITARHVVLHSTLVYYAIFSTITVILSVEARSSYPWRNTLLHSFPKNNCLFLLPNNISCFQLCWEM